ncbi:hypothetical protein FFE93_007120 [Yersinia sp. KBS0713]|nr:hypothetical protein FFE93_007120 [Yersinia sp. KBS0713]
MRVSKVRDGRHGVSGVEGSNPFMPTKIPQENQSVRVGFFVCGISGRETQGKSKLYGTLPG